jgi:Protein of unknown function (DUF3795)
MSRTGPTTPALIAPCGINCRICLGYLRETTVCPGCRLERTSKKQKSCVNCRIKKCEKLVRNGWDYCYECDEFPCFLVARLDKRYRTKYWASPIGNLRRIQAGGIEQFILEQDQEWICPSCGALLCMHKPQCLACGYDWKAAR